VFVDRAIHEPARDRKLQQEVAESGCEFDIVEPTKLDLCDNRKASRPILRVSRFHQAQPDRRLGQRGHQSQGVASRRKGIRFDRAPRANEQGKPYTHIRRRPISDAVYRRPVWRELVSQPLAEHSCWDVIEVLTPIAPNDTADLRCEDRKELESCS
jgi:hypothetical protein